MLMAVLTCCIGMGIVACSSDEGDAKTDNRVVTEDGKTYMPDSLLTEEERYLMAAANAVGNIVRNLTGKDVSLDELTGNTYEPTYGQTLDGEASSVRATKALSTEYAEQMFLAMTGVNDDEDFLLTATPDGYELSLRDLPVLEDGKRCTLGTLTFHRDSGSPRYGYVEVDIPCIPHLERIDYLSAEAFPDNADSPYQPGDVVYVDHDATGYCGGYYLCVAVNGYRSTLVHLCTGEPGGDETVNFDNDKDGCWVPYNGREKGDETTYDDILDYISFIAANKAKVNTIKAFMNGEAYDMKPTRSGKLGHLFPEGFNNDRGVVYINTWGAEDGCKIYYNAYFGKYHAGYCYDHRHPQYAHVPHNCTSANQVERKTDDYVLDGDFKTGNQYYTMNVIHARDVIKGGTLELSATKTLLLGVPASAATTTHLGWCYADDGILYETAAKAEKYGHKPLGILAFVNTGKGEWMDKATEKERGFGHGLVLSYYWANDGQTCRMNPSNDDLFTEETEHTSYVENNLASVSEDFDGLTRTEMLDAYGSPAASAATSLIPAAPTNTSGWFIPSTGQWMAMLCNDKSGGLSGLGNGKWSKDASDTAADNSVFVIRNSNDWDTFRRMIDEAKGNKRINAMLAADISTVYTAALYNTWCGTFNGNGHTINVNISGGGLECVALFRYARDFTIKNLNITGKIKGSNHVAGLVGNSTVSNSANRNHIENCRVSASIECSNWIAGGFIGRGNYADILNCLFDGSIWCQRAQANGNQNWAGAFYGFIDGDLACCVQTSLEKGTYYNLIHIGLNIKPWESWGNGTNQWTYNNWSYSNLPKTKNASAVARETMLSDLGTDNWQVDASGKVVPRMIDETVNPWYTGSNVAVGGDPIATINNYLYSQFGGQDVWTSSASSATVGVWMSTYFKEPYFSWKGDAATYCHVRPVFAF